MKFARRAFVVWVLVAIASVSFVSAATGTNSLRRQGRLQDLSLVQNLQPDAVGNENFDVKDKLAEELKKSEKTFQKIKDMHKKVPDMLKRDSEQLKANFLPGWHFDVVVFTTIAFSMFFSVAWFVFYFLKIYENDRVQNMDRWDAKMEIMPDEIVEKIHPDLVLVLPHPGCEAAKVNTAVDSSTLQHAMVINKTSGQVLPKTEALLQKVKENEARQSSLSVIERTESLQRKLTHGEDSIEEQPPSVTDACIALIQDLHTSLPKMGFDVKTFSSVDKDEVFMAISLQRMDIGSSYLLRSSAALQIKQSVVAKVGIDQPPDEIASSPPWIRYDPRMVERLHAAGVLEKNDPRDLYCTFHGRDEEGVIINGSERIRIIYKALSQHLDLDYAMAHGLLVNWYPAHNPNWIVKFWATWGSWRSLKDFSFVQPLQQMTEYFGSRVSFIFGWNGLYCKALLPLAALSIVAEVVAFVLKHVVGMDPAQVQMNMAFGFGVIIIIWSRIASNLWDREEGLFMKLWNLNPEMQELTMRPSFKGDMKPSPANLNVLEKQYPTLKANLRRIASALTTLIFCGVVFAWVVVWTNMFEGRMDVTASICLSIQIVVFGVIFSILTPILTDWENHKYQNTYYDSYLWKQILFQTVNSYTAFLYLSVKQRHTAARCPPGGCMVVLKKQLLVTLIILSVSRIAEVIIASYVVKFKLWLEAYQMGDMSVKRFYTERQSKLATYRLREQIQAMTQLVISLGFVLLFGVVAPVTVPLCLAVFMVQLRASAFLLLRYTIRPLPRKQFGIGRWRAVVQALMRGGVLFTAFLLVEFNKSLRETPLITKMTVIVLFCLGMEVVWICVDAFCPSQAEETEVLIARRTCVTNVLAHKCEEINKSEDEEARHHPKLQRGHSSRFIGSAIDEAKWDCIPRLEEDDEPIESDY